MKPMPHRTGTLLAQAMAGALAAWMVVACAPGGRAAPPAPSRTATKAPPATAAVSAHDKLSAVWAQEGGAKVPREDLWASSGRDVKTRAWDGTRVALFGARNEVVNAAVVLEAARDDAHEVAVRFDRLVGPGGATIASKPASSDQLFEWVDRPIELFHVRYLRIRGLSVLSYEDYDERHVPERLQRPHSSSGVGKGEWKDRPDHDKHYPDAAVPMELVPSFDVGRGSSQMVWVDVYIPRTAAPGLYRGDVIVTQRGKETHRLPVELTVHDFALPDVPAARSMIFLGDDSTLRYLGEGAGEQAWKGAAFDTLRDKHFLLAHRHKLSLIDSDPGVSKWGQDAPRAAWLPRLDGSLFSARRGYDGPGQGVGNGVYSIGTYGSWGWVKGGQPAMRRHLDRWGSWFARYAPSAEVFLYLIDESDDFPVIERWARWIRDNPGPGNRVKSFATLGLADAGWHTPSLSIPCATVKVAQTAPWERAATVLAADPDKVLCTYNGARPASGTLMTDDDGVAMRTWGWIQHKKKIDRWFVWESTYYDNYQAGMGQTNVWRRAQTFGKRMSRSKSKGETGWNYANGDGVLFYPGVDKVYQTDAPGLNGPVASLRLKYWRRGVQDADYLALAAAKAPRKVAAIVNRLIPKVMWEVGVDDPEDPTWKRTPISWPTSPDVWEAARAELAGIIVGGR